MVPKRYLTADNAEAKEKKNQAAITDIKKKAQSELTEPDISYYDVTVTKTVKEEGKEDKTIQVSETSSVIELVIPYDLTKKNSVKAYKNHEGATTELDESSTKGIVDTFNVDWRENKVYVYMKEFSVYSIAASGDDEPESAHSERSTVTSFTGVKSGNDFTFENAVVVTKATLPNASSAKITNTSGSGWYNFKLDAISVKNKTVNDVSLVGYTTKYLTTENGYAKYSTVIPGEGTYTIDFVDNAATQGTTEPKTEEKKDESSSDTQGYLKVTSTPAGAAIQIEGVNYKGVTPQAKIALNPGTYTVTSSLDGYKDASKSFTIKAGETTPVTLTLEKKEKTASETTTPTTTKSPFPIFGILVGVGAAMILMRRRR